MQGNITASIGISKRCFSFKSLVTDDKCADFAAFNHMRWACFWLLVPSAFVTLAAFWKMRLAWVSSIFFLAALAMCIAMLVGIMVPYDLISSVRAITVTRGPAFAMSWTILAMVLCNGAVAVGTAYFSYPSRIS